MRGEVKRYLLSTEGKLALVGLAIAAATLVSSSALGLSLVHRLAAQASSPWLS